ncbi:hypothetical protein F4W70_22845 [Pseudomonas cannabina]|nr:hypothetical protein F4W70_22845 [Pseudomonas cannabina]
MRTSLGKAPTLRNRTKTLCLAQVLMMPRIATSAERSGLRGRVKNPLPLDAEPPSRKDKITTQKPSTRTQQTDQSPKTNGNVLHNHPPTSHLGRQRSIFFN